MTTFTAVSNVTALRALSGGSSAPMVFIKGYDTITDGGEGTFVYDLSDTTSADNGGTILVDASGNRYYRELQGLGINVKWFGAAGNGTTDDTTALTNAAAYLNTVGGGELWFPAGQYLVDKAIVLYSNTKVRGTGYASCMVSTSGNTDDGTTFTSGSFFINGPK